MIGNEKTRGWSYGLLHRERESTTTPFYFFVGVLGDDRFEDFGELTSSFG